MHSIVLKWQYLTGFWFEHECGSAATCGHLYQLKCSQQDIAVVQVWCDGKMVIEWKSNVKIWLA